MIRIAAEVGAKAAMDRLDKERAKEKQDKVDRRLRNTKLLLENYRLLKKHTENAICDAEQLDESVYDILYMMERSSGPCIVESVKISVARTAILVGHVEAMLRIYGIYCKDMGKPEDLRRWRAVQNRYMDEHEKTVLEIADQEHVSDRTIRRDIEAARDHLAGLFFGIDGIQR